MPTRVEVSGAGGEEIKGAVNAKMSTQDFLSVIRNIYSLDRPAEEPEPGNEGPPIVR